MHVFYVYLCYFVTFVRLSHNKEIAYLLTYLLTFDYMQHIMNRITESQTSPFLGLGVTKSRGALLDVGSVLE